MRAHFGRKISNLAELIELTEQAIKSGKKGQPYQVTREVVLEDNEFKEFANDFLQDQPWLTENDGGMNADGEIRCIRVINKDTWVKILTNNEAYQYGRYVALEK